MVTMTRVVATLALGTWIGVSVVGCGGSGAPTAPTSASGGSPTASSGGSTSTGATISGTVAGAASANAIVGASTELSFGALAITGMRVAVQGTNVSTDVSSSGAFSLGNVPAGDARLQFSGGGANATTTVSALAAGESVSIVVAVSGTTAVLLSDSRRGSLEQELEGRIDGVPASDVVTVDGRKVKVIDSTRITEGGAAKSVADLKVGVRVHVKGAVDGDVLVASSITIQNTNTEIQVPWNGIVESLKGSASAFEFVIGSKTIKGDANTAFFGDGDKPDSFSTLKNGQRVEVKGLQRDGYLYAMRIHINGTGTSTTPPGQQDTSASIEGTLTSIGGSGSNLTLKVGSTTVTTSSDTTVQRRGDKQDLSTLKTGMTLHVVGTRKSDGSLEARLIQIKDDEVGGVAEIQGSAGGVKGNCPTLTFVVNGYNVSTNGSTKFSGVACGDLKSGTKVTVKGPRQSDGSILATDVTKN